jgi:uncharacterized protein (TIGR02996 family)
MISERLAVYDLYTSSEVLAFLQDAKRHPGDDTPRLILADYLEDRGDGHRAEFIRLQCRLASDARPPLTDMERIDLAFRADDLLNRHGGAWLGPLWCWGGAGQGWHRGLLNLRVGRRLADLDIEPLLPWIDAVGLDVTGLDALRRALALLDAGMLNHASFDLRQPFSEATLLRCLGRVRELPCLRTLTFGWHLRSMRRQPRLTPAGESPGRTVPALPPRFFARLVRELPLGRRLTHLASSLAWTRAQRRCLKEAGVEAVQGYDFRWTQRRPATVFGGRLAPARATSDDDAC